DRHAEQIVAGPHTAMQIGARVARGEVDEPELGIDRRRLPDRRAAELPRVPVLRPALVPRPPGTRHGIERPRFFAVLRTERLNLAAARPLAAREADDHEPVVVERRAREAEALLPRLRD